MRLSAPQPGETVLEVGPGFGALTRKLLASGADVYAVEFDHRIAEYLRTHLEANNFHLTEADACRVNYLELLPQGRPFRAIANLPYSISTIFIARMLDLPEPPEAMFFMLQREMGERLAAPVGTKDYGALSVRTQLRYEVKLEKIVPPEVFFPPPEVDSAIGLFPPPRALFGGQRAVPAAAGRGQNRFRAAPQTARQAAVEQLRQREGASGAGGAEHPDRNPSGQAHCRSVRPINPAALRPALTFSVKHSRRFPQPTARSGNGAPFLFSNALRRPIMQKPTVTPRSNLRCSSPAAAKITFNIQNGNIFIYDLNSSCSNSVFPDILQEFLNHYLMPSLLRASHY